jgi:uncharacterized protein
MRYRRFGATELPIPVISCGGMRFQHSWKDEEDVPEESQRNVEACVRRALELGITHIETARGYGTSEYQLGKFLPGLPRDGMIVQTKVGPEDDVSKFVANFERSMKLLGLDYVDLFAFHGINNADVLAAAMKCMDKALAWKKAGRIRHIGFSTHGPTNVLLDAVKTGAFEYINLHWYYIFQDNWPVIEEATRRDMGVFIISPNEKAGLLFKPSAKLLELCAPLHPMIFNGLFCLARPEVHTLSCGVSCPEDFDIHLEIPEKLDQAAALTQPIVERLEAVLRETVGEEWFEHWESGLPEWDETPGEINIPVILRLRNLALAYDMIEYGRMRYNLLGNGGHWFPGKKADKLGEVDLTACLAASPFAERIPGYLAETHRLLEGEEIKRLQAES